MKVGAQTSPHSQPSLSPFNKLWYPFSQTWWRLFSHKHIYLIKFRSVVAMMFHVIVFFFWFSHFLYGSKSKPGLFLQTSKTSSEALLHCLHAYFHASMNLNQTILHFIVFFFRFSHFPYGWKSKPGLFGQTSKTSKEALLYCLPNINEQTKQSGTNNSHWPIEDKF